MHPYRLSRVLVLANWEALERIGRPVASFTVEGFEAGYSIPEIASFKEGDDPCFYPNKEKRCLEYRCQAPSLPREEAEIIDSVVERVKGLGDVELNRLVVRDKRYKELLEKGGF